jgi:Lar family restriction alleviation protein
MGELTDERIAPCPKCGGTDTKVARYSYPDQAFAQCRACGANGPDGDTAADAITQWNRWAEHGKLTAELARLRGENERLLSVAKNLGHQCRLILDYWDKPLSPGEQVWQRKAEQYLTELEKLIIERALRGEAQP